MKIEADERDASMRNRRPPARIAPPATNWFDKHKPRRAPSGSPPPPARELNEDEQREADAEAARAELGAAARLGDGSLPSRFCGVKAVYFAGEVFIEFKPWIEAKFGRPLVGGFKIGAFEARRRGIEVGDGVLEIAGEDVHDRSTEVIWQKMQCAARPLLVVFLTAREDARAEVRAAVSIHATPSLEIQFGAAKVVTFPEHVGITVTRGLTNDDGQDDGIAVVQALGHGASEAGVEVGDGVFEIGDQNVLSLPKADIMAKLRTELRPLRVVFLKARDGPSEQQRRDVAPAAAIKVGDEVAQVGARGAQKGKLMQRGVVREGQDNVRFVDGSLKKLAPSSLVKLDGSAPDRMPLDEAEKASIASREAPTPTATPKRARTDATQREAKYKPTMEQLYRVLLYLRDNASTPAATAVWKTVLGKVFTDDATMLSNAADFAKWWDNNVKGKASIARTKKDDIAKLANQTGAPDERRKWVEDLITAAKDARAQKKPKAKP